MYFSIACCNSLIQVQSIICMQSLVDNRGRTCSFVQTLNGASHDSLRPDSGVIRRCVCFEGCLLYELLCLLWGRVRVICSTWSLRVRLSATRRSFPLTGPLQFHSGRYWERCHIMQNFFACRQSLTCRGVTCTAEGMKKL